MNRQRLAEEISKYETPEGDIDSERLLADAREKTHPLNGAFNWDDEKCGHIYRLGQLRMYIRMVKAEYREEDHVTVRTFKYVHNPSLPPKQHGYRRVSMIAQDGPSKVDVFLTECEQVLGRFKRLRDIAVALGLSGRIQFLMDQLVSLSDQIRVAPPVVEDDEGSRMSG